MSATFESPELNKSAFTCPHCGAFAAMQWSDLITQRGGWKPFLIATCHRCQKDSLWINEEGYGGQFMVFPDSSIAPLPNEDLPPECMKDYLEARAIVEKSPRGAAALLRLGVLGGDGRNINDDIAHLVKNGLPVRVQQALDVVRVVGNNAVHPGEMNIDDQPKTALALFGLVNLIVDNQISQPKQVANLFTELPGGARDAIGKRDNKA